MPVSEYLKESVRAKWSQSPPADWEFLPFGDVLRRVSRSVDIEDDVEYLQPVIRRGHGGIELRETQYGRNIRTKRQFRILADDWLMSKVQILHRSYGIVPPSLDGAIASGSYYAFEPTDHIDLRFLWYLSHHPTFHESCALASVGVVIEKMVFRVQDWQEFNVLLPPVPEQRKIAAILSSVDDAIATTRKVIEQTKRVKQGLLQALVTRGIGHTRFKKTEIGEIPETWQVAHLSRVADVIVSSVNKKSETHETPICLCNYTDVYKHNTISEDLPFMEATASEAEIEKFTLRPGDVIITKDSEDPSDIGVPAFVPADFEASVVCGYHLAILRPSGVVPSYLSWVLRSKSVRDQFERRASGTTRFGLKIKTIRSTLLPLPPPDEQTRIVALLAVTQATILANRELAGLTSGLQQLSKLKHGLMQDLLTGRVRVQAG